MQLTKLNLILMLLVFFIFVWLGRLLPDFYQHVSREQAAIEMLSVNKDCNVTQEPCTAAVDGKEIRVRLHGPVRYLQHFDYSIETNGFTPDEIKKITVQFDMTEMQMGLNRYLPRFSEIDQRWHGVAVLPVCVSGRKDWRVTVLLDSESKKFRSHFNFSVGEK